MDGKAVKYKIVFSFWIGLGFLTGFQYWLINVQQGASCGFFVSVFQEFPTYVLWGFYTILILYLSGKYPLERGKRTTRILLIHLPVSLLLSFFHLGLMSVYYKLMVVSRPDLSMTYYFSNFALTRSLYQLLIYTGVLVTAEAWNFWGKIREERQLYAETERALVQARLDALKMQLQPHFLFNTLNTISMLVRKRDENEATKVLATLGDLLRYVLDTGNQQWVKLGDELEFIDKYLSIESLRFSGRLVYTIDAQSGVKEIPVPDLLLQPVVENSVKHGLAGMKLEGRIDIVAKIDEGSLKITVTDNGKGFSGDYNVNGKGGIGLKNTIERIESLYHGEAGFSIKSEPGMGTKVEYTLPVISGMVYETV